MTLNQMKNTVKSIEKFYFENLGSFTRDEVNAFATVVGIIANEIHKEEKGEKK